LYTRLSIDSVDLLSKIINKAYGLHCTVSSANTIFFPTIDILKLREIVIPHILDHFLYKLSGIKKSAFELNSLDKQNLIPINLNNNLSCKDIVLR
jgi:hypothetical protein